MCPFFLHRGRVSLACVPTRRVGLGPIHPLTAPCSRFGTAEPTKMILDAADHDKLPPSSSPIPTNLKSQFVGISWHRSRAKWAAHIVVQRKKNHLGYYPCEEEAARAFDEQAGALGRPVNFPKEGQKQAEKRGGHGFFSKFAGVCWHVSGSKWVAQVTLEDGSQKSLGLFDDEAEAARAYDRRARTLDRPLNFPGEGESKALKTGTSNFQGTHWNGKEWEAEVIGLGERTHLGVFASEVEAARAYDDHLVAVFSSSRVNFPGEGAGELRQANVEPKSKFVGVSWDSRQNKWGARNMVNGKTEKSFHESEGAAARAYDERAAPLGRPVNFTK